MYSTLPFIGSMMIYSSTYSISIGWMINTFGMSDFCGASSLMFAKDGVTSSTNTHSTWICILNAPMAPL
jgi:hypothetical protein